LPKSARTHKQGHREPDNRPNAHRRGYGGKRWDHVRMAIFLRDNYTCQMCGQVCVRPGKGGGGVKDFKILPACDHIIPKAEGGTDEPDNLQTLCGSCHAIKTNREKYGKGKQ